MQKQYFTRAESSAFLTELGAATSPKTLAKLASIGGGPTYQRFGKRALYRPQDLESWVQQKLSAPRKSATRGATA